jgi:multidrug resistance efflux pump
MRRLRERRNQGDLKNQPRARRQSIIRWLYLASVALLAGWLGNLFFGDLLLFRSEGLVLGEPAIVAAEFPVTVRYVPVRDGELVTAGSVAALVTSQTVIENIARLTADLASREARISELRIRRQTIDAILGIAESRQSVAANARSEFEKLVNQGYLALDKRTAAVESEFRSRQDLEGLKAEKRVIDSEVETLSNAFAQAAAALQDLRRLYDDGQLRVPIDGVVSRVVADQGAVIRPGDPLVEVYGNQRFVLAYLPTGALYDVRPGDRVQIESGLRASEGRVVNVQPFAAALPREFQRAFSPVDRRQVIRVEFLPDEVPPPLFSKVKLRSAEIVPSWIRAYWQSSGAPVVADVARPKIAVGGALIRGTTQ